MAERLNRDGWRNAVKNHREQRFSPANTIEQEKKRIPRVRNAVPSKEWTKRIVAEREKGNAGGRHRALSQPSKAKRGRRPTGGMLKSNSARRRPALSEEQRKARVKTGDQVPKKGINASSWAYDHRKATAARRSKAVTKKPSGEKKGINAEKWHYDHEAAKKATKTRMGKGKPTTHVPAERKRAAQKKSLHGPAKPTRPQRPTPPKRIEAKAPKKAPVPRKPK